MKPTLSILFLTLNILVTKSFAQKPVLIQNIEQLENEIKKTPNIIKNAKINCHNQWQKIILDKNGKILKASGGMPIGCHIFEKIIYLKNDSVIAYRELYHPLNNPECSEAQSSRFCILATKNKHLAFDEIADTTIHDIDSSKITLDLESHKKALFRDLNSMCHCKLSHNESIIRDLHVEILKQKIKPFTKINKLDANEKFVAYFKNEKLILLKSSIKTSSKEISSSYYFNENQLIEYNYDENLTTNDTTVSVNSDRFQIEDGKIKNFKYLEITNPNYQGKESEEILKIISNIAIKKKEEFLESTNSTTF